MSLVVISSDTPPVTKYRGVSFGAPDTATARTPGDGIGY
jgi:hypothetical protein